MIGVKSESVETQRMAKVTMILGIKGPRSQGSHF